MTNLDFFYFTSADYPLIVLLTVFIVIFLVYLFIDHLPKIRKNRITSRNEPGFVKAMAVLATGALLSAAWDTWWHMAVGQDTFWEVPHIFLYAFVSAGIFLSFYVWLHSRDIRWKHIFLTMLLIPMAGGFDNFWHSIHGVENFTKPMLFPWSPPHILMQISAILVFVQLIMILVRYRKTHDFNFFGNLCFGGISVIALALVMPLHPTELWGQIAGFVGAGALAAVFVFISLAAEKTMKGRLDATLTVTFMLMIFFASYSQETISKISFIPHDRPPAWLYVFSYFAAAVLLDITKDRFPVWVRGAFAGLLWSSILFGFATQFFADKFQYGLTEIFTAVTFSTLGGLVAASCLSVMHLTDQEHIEKMFKKW